MSKKLSAIIALLGITILGLVAAPIFFNYQYGRSYLEHALQAFKNPYFDLKIQSFKNNLFSSDAEIALRFKDNVANPQLSALESTNMFNMKVHMQYGPIIIARSINGGMLLKIAAALVSYEKPGMAQNPFFKSPILAGQSLISFNNDVSTTLQGFTSNTNPLFKFDGIKMQWTTTNNNKKVQGRFTTGELNASQGPVKILMIKPSSLDINLAQTPLGLYTGTVSYLLPQVKSFQTPFELNDIAINANSTIQQNLWSQASALSIGKYTWPLSSGQAKITSDFKNWNAPGLAKFKTSMSQLQPTQTPEQIETAVLNGFNGIFTDNTSANFSVAFMDTQFGKLDYSSGFANNKTTFNVYSKLNTQRLYLKALDNMYLTAAVSLAVNNLNRTAFANFFQFCVKSGDDKLSKDPATQQQLIENGKQLFQADTQGNFVINLTTETFGSFDLLNSQIKPVFAQTAGAATSSNNQQQLNDFQLTAVVQVPKPLVDDLLQLSTDQLLIKYPLLQKMQNSTDKLTKLKNDVQDYLQQGYLKQQNNFYVANFAANRTTMTVNGKPFPAPQQDQQAQKNQIEIADALEAQTNPVAAAEQAATAAEQASAAMADQQEPSMKTVDQKALENVEKADITDSLIAAANKGDVNAQYKLGLLFEKGQGMPQNLAQAKAWLEKAAKQNHVGAMKQLGIIYLNDTNTPNHYQLAEKYFSQAAKLGDVSSQTNLAVLYLTGPGGIHQDSVKGIRLLNDAATHNDPVAQYNLSVIYFQGKFADKDLIRAYAWAMLAADRNNNAKALMTTLDNQLNEQQIEQAQKLSSEIMKKISNAAN